MSVRTILSRSVDTIRADESARFAANRMQQRGVGCLVVVNGEEEPIGIVTDRDLTLRVLAEGREPETTSVASVMTAPSGVVDDGTPIESALRIMRQAGVRRLPVVGSSSGRLVGIVTLDDVLKFLSEELNEVGKLLGAESPEEACRP